MKRVSIYSAQSGQKIARTIFGENGNVLLGAGVELTEKYIDRLTKMGIDMIYVEDATSEGIVPTDMISDATRKKAVEAVHQTLTGLAERSSGRASNVVIGSTFRNVFSTILAELTTKKDVLVHLTNLNVMDGYLFQHSVNVAVLAGIMGMAKGYNQNQLMDLGVGALLFDIGMTTVPLELLVKNGPLTPAEREIINGHCMNGYNILKSQHDISLLSAHCALQHHERYSGIGYPRKISQANIHEYAQIVGLADTYDALVSPRPYRARLSPSDAAEILFASGNELFDIELLRLFFKHIALYPVSTTVMFNTGQVGIVSEVHTLAPNRPTIRVTHEPDGSMLKSPYDLDLRTHLNVTIVKTL